jgi:hypothetical protein
MRRSKMSDTDPSPAPVGGCDTVIEHAAQTGGYVYWSGIRRAWDFISYDEAHEMAADELAELHAVHIPKGFTP